MSEKDFCDTFWGSHGCDLPPNHDPDEEHPVHRCEVPEYDEDGRIERIDFCTEAQYLTKDTIKIRYFGQDDWHEWVESPLGLFGLDDRENVR